jgi:hypothetical protein
VYASIYGVGYHVIASNDPIPRLSAEELVARMPAAAVSGHARVERLPTGDCFFGTMLGHEYAVDSLLIDRRREATLAISDDRPVNEFFLMRVLARGDSKALASENQSPPARLTRARPERSVFVRRFLLGGVSPGAKSSAGG